ncbi:hypothetical protein G6F23_015261 [Rhizopus arrhizus]|nr:hypothetical protein G6F23_015261 [Rhizopus arrhizus]
MKPLGDAFINLHDPPAHRGPGVRQGDGVLPVLLHAGADRRHDRGARGAARRRHEHQPGRAGPDRGAQLRREVA